MKTEYLIIKEENTFCNSKDTFINLLSTNGEISVTSKIIKHKKFEVKFSLNTAVVKGKKKDERHFTVTLERDTTKAKPDTVIANFTEVNRLFKKIIKESNLDFRLITLWDDVSVYYSHKAYPLINEIENLMRKLIFKFMFTNVGMDWLEAAAPKDFRESVQKKVDKGKVKDIIENSLYEADFIHLAAFLFKEYSTADLTKLTDKIKAAKKNTDIDLKDLEELVPKSNWERYFAKHIQFDGLEKKWKELYELRNTIAHNKPINVGEFNRIQTLHTEIKEKLEKALLIEKLGVTENDKKEVSEIVASDLFEEYSPDVDFSFSTKRIDVTPDPKVLARVLKLLRKRMEIRTTPEGIFAFSKCDVCGQLYKANGDQEMCNDCNAQHKKD